MTPNQILEILTEIEQGNVSPKGGQEKIMAMISGNLGFAEVDMARSLRRGFPEVVFCQNKEKEDVAAIAKKLLANEKPILLTRANKEIYDLLIKEKIKEVAFHQRSRCITIRQPKETKGLVTIVSAGTSDIPIAEEAAVTAAIMGANVQTYWDIGIAGIHRVMNRVEELRKSRVIIVVAGMDGALPGVVGGLVSCPVIGVPTSIGYGTGTGGFAALMTMLNSCSPGVSVVNIDNGFGAGYSASLINNL